MKEIWKPIIFKGIDYSKMYEVSNFGNIRKNGKALKLMVLNDKYNTIYLTLSVNNSVSALVHILVWESFNGKIRKGFVIQHKDDNGFNNNLSNLRYISKRFVSANKNGLPVGVSYRKDSKRYVVSFGNNNKRISLGTYDDPIIAGEAYKAAYNYYLDNEFATNEEIKKAASDYRVSKGLRPIGVKKVPKYEDVKPKHIIYNF
jgi:hypothetical protein